jgi:hypothetical protein
MDNGFFVLFHVLLCGITDGLDIEQDYTDTRNARGVGAVRDFDPVYCDKGFWLGKLRDTCFFNRGVFDSGMA